MRTSRLPAILAMAFAPLSSGAAAADPVQVFLAGLSVSAAPLTAGVPRDPPSPVSGFAAVTGIHPPEDVRTAVRSEQFGPLGLPCAGTITAVPGEGATVMLRIEAPCAPLSPVTIAHGQLRATYLSSGSGTVEALFPAFEDNSLYRATLPDGSFLEASTFVPGASGYEHVATIWSEGQPGLHVHAFEFGAKSGEPGHVWQAAPRSPLSASAGRGGYHLSLGTAGIADGVLAEVYSFPSAQAARAGTVRVGVAAHVGPGSCGHETRGDVLQIGKDLPGQPVEVRLTLQDCDGAPRHLMLKNLARDLKIAAN